MRMGLERYVAQENWKNAARVASNLSELLQARGELREALAQAWNSVELADKSGDAEERMDNRTTLAAALHAMGYRGEATAQFEQAERMQKEQQPAYPLLYSLPGFRSCDLLLDQGREVGVRERAAQAMTIAEDNHWLLDIALNHLSLGRTHFLAIQRGASDDLAQAASHLVASVDGLRHAGYQDMLPLGLLARAALHTHTRGFALARKDLDEAFSIATRSGFRLFETDAHLGYARLCLAEGAAGSARPHVDAARKLIEGTGYHRRDGEVAEIERALAAALGWERVRSWLGRVALRIFGAGPTDPG
jgi:tetratricopeptide (TPR) repeat protein